MSGPKEHPILFSASMVRALLDGSKTQTRRVVTQQPQNGWAFDGSYGRITSTHHKKGKFGAFIMRWVGTDFPECDLIVCPYGQPGDQLWVRETFADLNGTGIEHRPVSSGPLQRYAFAADIKPGSYGDEARKEFGVKWKPSIFMPRAASRITLVISGVRVERLQDISEADARAEGCSGGHGSIPGYDYAATPQEAYAHLWKSINGPGSWPPNPWVWVIEFRVVQA